MQISSVAGKKFEGEEAAPAMSIAVDLCSTKNHGHHLQDEAARKQVFTLRSGEASVKSRNGTTVAGWKGSEQRATVPCPALEKWRCLRPVGFLSNWTTYQPGLPAPRADEAKQVPTPFAFSRIISMSQETQRQRAWDGDGSRHGVPKWLCQYSQSERRYSFPRRA